MAFCSDLLAGWCARLAQALKEPKPGSLDFCDKWELSSSWWVRAEGYAREAVHWQRAAERARRYGILLRPHDAAGEPHEQGEEATDEDATRTQP